ncbi:TPA: alcohol dehydrogenase [Candidatus Sumerlaeota bacterium]|jgi:alcohol dehydrogenase|nr:alcohol dehydrogenase [Candidatus Sumerlaeota bacterium]
MNNDYLLNLRKFVVPEFVYGEGAINLVGQHVRSFGAEKALLVTDSGIIQAGWVKKVEENLIQEGIPYVIFSDVTQNPKDSEVMAGAKVYLEHGCDIILAIGGGSPMDAAKGIGVVSTNNKHVLEFEGVDKVPIPGPPLICIPTTAGTAADVSQFAIINDCSRKVKVAIISKTVVPDVALIDPQTTTTMWPELTAATGIDALVHACESYVSSISSPITDLTALEAIRLIYENLIPAIQHPLEMEFRDKMMRASLLAGMAFSNASLGLVHSMAHSLGGLLDLAHGICNAILLEYVVEFNYAACPDKYDKIAEAMHVEISHLNAAERKLALLDRIKKLRCDAGITQTLGEYGVNTSVSERLAYNASLDPCLATNPREATVEEIKAIYERAL